MKQIFLICLFIVPLSLFSKEFNIIDFGAKRNNKTNTEFIQKAIDACNENGGGTVIIPQGTFFSGTLFLKSNVTLEIEKGGMLKAVDDVSEYPFIPPGIKAISRMDVEPWRAFIYAYDQENIKLCGEGDLYGGGDYGIFQTHKGNDPNRPYGIHLVSCKNVEVSDLHLTNSAFWMLRMNYCTDILIHNVHIFNHSNLNNDGIDLDCCQFVRVSDSHIDACDDALCFKTEGPRATSDVVVNNCILSSFASPFKLGTGSAGNFERFAVSNLVIRPSRSLKNHHEFQAWGGLGGIDLGCVDGGSLKDLTFSNIVVDSVETPIFIRLGMRHDRPYEKGEFAGKGEIKNIKFSNIVATNAGKIACSVTGYKDAQVENISFNNIDIHFKGGGTIEDAQEEVPMIARSYPVNRMFGVNMPAYGFFIRDVKTISFKTIQFHLMNEDQRPAMVLENVENFYLKDFRMDTSTSLPLIKVKDSKNIQITGQNELKTSDALIQVDGDKSEGIYLYETDFDHLVKPTQLVGFNVNSAVNCVSFNELSWSRKIADGNISFFNIYRDGEFLTRTRQCKYIDMAVQDATNYSYELEAINGRGVAAPKLKLNVKTATDKAVPEITSFRLIDNETIELKFSEPISKASLHEINNYEFKPNLKVVQISSIDDFTANVTVAGMQENVEYTCKIEGLKDKAKKANIIQSFTTTFIDSPVLLHYRFDDLSKANHVESRVGILGKAGYFNGENSFIDLGDKQELNCQGNMAIAVWFKLDNPEKNSYYRILSKRSAWNSPNGYELEVNPLQTRINITGGSTGADDQGVVKANFDTEWHHLVAMIKDGKAIFYLDGKLHAKDDLVAAPQNNQVNLVIGATPNYTDVFEGCLDELYIFNRALSEMEIIELFNRR
ncbi:MAG: LamG-like jellyroll fold domain-containing protein [Prolixibacteraceae bacterium]